MNPALRIRPLWLLSAVLLGCSSGAPTGQTGSGLRVTVQGLPSGSPAAITVTGPGGFSEPVTATQTFTQLTPGTYAITATSVSASGVEYSPTPESQSVAVGSSLVNATVNYSTSTGDLAVTISGLGTGSAAAVTVTGTGYSQAVPSTTTLRGLNPGSYTITARDTVASGGTPHTASPTSQTVTVAVQSTASASVAYSPPSTGPLNLHIAGLYITQSTQTYPATVPLVSNRNGYLRIFVIANRTTISTEVPTVRVRFYNGALLPVDSALITNAQVLSVPTAVDESSLKYTWNVPVPASLIQPGLSIQAVVDPANAVLESIENDNVFPATGPAVADVHSVPTLRVTFVPIFQSANGLRGDVTSLNKDAFLDMSRRMHPIAAVDAVVSDTPYTTSTTLQANGTGWEVVLSEVYMANLTAYPLCAIGRYCYGVVRVPYSSGVAGIAYVSQGTADAQTALGWDYLPSGSIVAAHELAHNWGRNHAPCGGPADPDPSYPQADGSIGSYGWDLGTDSLKLASVSDIMGYCDPKWIGDYSYRGVMNYRMANPLVTSTSGAETTQPSLLVWGRINNGELVLEPAFQITTVPRLPTQRGPFSIGGLAEDGSTIFELSFTPRQVADLPGRTEQHFAFAVPLPKAKADRLSSLRLRGGGREVVRRTAFGGGPDSLEVRRIGSRVGLRWNHVAHPVVMVRDPETGRVLSIARGGSAQIATGKAQVDLLLSDGVKSRLRRMQVSR